jgi:glutamate dehydrogenase/leucine dehydrogenase
MTKNGLLQTSVFNLEKASERLKLSDAMFARLLEPKEKIEITLNPVFTDGKKVHIKAFIVRHGDALGPAKGGIRMAPTVSLDDITGLSMEMTWKTALIGVPFGGGKSGICFDANSISAQDKEIIIRAFTRSAKRHIGPEIYVPAPDMGTNERDMGHIRDCISYSEGTSITRGCFVTGKPVILGGIIGRREATGKGVVFSILAACEKLGIDIKKAKVAVQGFGNVGSIAAKVISEMGAKVIAVSDVNGGVYNENGLDMESLQKCFNTAKKLDGFKDANSITNEELLTCKCDILLPAAAQSQITEANANKIKAKIIAEGANAPTTPHADEILDEKGVFVIPDILCNAGGVFVSYLEYTQETQREQMTIEQVEARLQNRMKTKFDEVFDYHNNKKCSMRQAAMDIAVRNVVDAVEARGFLP